MIYTGRLEGRGYDIHGEVWRGEGMIYTGRFGGVRV